MPRSKRRASNFKFDIPKQSPRKRKGSATTYKPPKDHKAAADVRRYIEFQADPKLNAESIKLRSHVNQCGTIFGGRKIWLRKKVRKPNGSEGTQSFPIIVDGRRCPNRATSTWWADGKPIRRCRDHQRSDFWIKDDPEANEEGGE